VVNYKKEKEIRQWVSEGYTFLNVIPATRINGDQKRQFLAQRSKQVSSPLGQKERGFTARDRAQQSLSAPSIAPFNLWTLSLKRRHDDHSLNFICSFINLGYLGIAHVPLYWILLYVPIPAENLDGLGRNLHGHVRTKALGHSG